MTTLQQMNNYTTNEFTQLFGDIFENSPWVAQKAAFARPFVSIEEAFQTMREIVELSSIDVKLALILEHPELGSRLQMSDSSVAEQVGAGLNALSAAEFEQMTALNAHYTAKFQFPFIIAVAGLNKQQIIQAIERRLQLDTATEFNTALQEIYKIAQIRFRAIIAQPMSI